MDTIINKLEKYRSKLINATEEDKIELYNLKMQQYLILQKKMQNGGSKDIFALTEATEKKMLDHEKVYSAKSVEHVLEDIKGKVKDASVKYNSLKEENSEITEQIIKLHRDAAHMTNIADVNNSPTVKGIEDAIKLFEPIQNVLVTYYVEELKKINPNDEDKVKIIASELGLFDKESTIQLIANELKGVELPSTIRDIIHAKKTEEPEKVEKVDDNELLGGRKRHIYKRY